jgi:FMN phosphatase YigB (HAD superfamily)
VSAAAWLVDLDGTLYHALPVQLCMAAQLLAAGPSATRAIAAFRRQHEQQRDSPERASDPFFRQLGAAADVLGVPVTDLEPLVRAYMLERPGRWIRLFRRRGLLAEIAHFRSSGGRCALVSDYPARSKLGALGATPLFDVIVAAGEPDGPSRLKPDPEGYLRAAELLQVEPRACLVIGDRDDADGAAARAAGMPFRCIGRIRTPSRL